MMAAQDMQPRSAAWFARGKRWDKVFVSSG
jgi:hypothetical protein